MSRGSARPGWVAIANPTAGRSGEVKAAVRRLRKAGLVDAVHLAERPGDTLRLAQAHRHAPGLVAIGGDGTVAQLIHAMDLQRQALAVLPCGHGNCLARDLGIGALRPAMSALQRGATRRIDLMSVRIERESAPPLDLLAASTLAAGYVADTVRFGRNRLPLLGRWAYAAASLLVRPRRLPVQVLADGWTALDEARASVLTGVVVNNTAHLANFRAFVGARLDDGRLDLMLQGHGWGRQMLHNAAILAGSRSFGPLRLDRHVSVELRFAKPEWLMVDGEMLAGVRKLQVRCLPGALACLHAPTP